MDYARGGRDYDYGYRANDVNYYGDDCDYVRDTVRVRGSNCYDYGVQYADFHCADVLDVARYVGFRNSDKRLNDFADGEKPPPNYSRDGCYCLYCYFHIVYTRLSPAFVIANGLQVLHQRRKLGKTHHFRRHIKFPAPAVT